MPSLPHPDTLNGPSSLCPYSRMALAMLAFFCGPVDAWWWWWWLGFCNLLLGLFKLSVIFCVMMAEKHVILGPDGTSDGDHVRGTNDARHPEPHSSNKCELAQDRACIPHSTNVSNCLTNNERNLLRIRPIPRVRLRSANSNSRNACFAVFALIFVARSAVLEGNGANIQRKRLHV